jgi:hypothetical protein
MLDRERIRLEVERRFPYKALALVLIGGLGGAAMLGWCLGLLGDTGSMPGYVPVFGGILLLMAATQLPDVLAYVFGAKRLVLENDRFVYGSHSHAYASVAGITVNITGETTRVWLASGERLVLRWVIWSEPDVWSERLQERSFRPLYEAAKAAFERGERVSFGKGIALDRKALHFPKGSIDLAEIDEVRFASSSYNGSQRRSLHVGSLRQRLVIDESRVHNQRVLLALLGESLPGQAGTSAGPLREATPDHSQG